MFPLHNLKVVDKPGPAFGSIEHVLTKPIVDKKFYDNLKYDEEVSRLLDQVEEEFLRDKPENDDSPENIREFLRDKLENYDFPEDTHHVGSIPDSYRDMLKNKIKEAKSRLENLSNLVCAISPSTAAHIKRIEDDHSAVFCKMDYPRHPPMHKPWRNTWTFRYAKQCKETDSSNHTHLADCKNLVVEDFETGVCVNSPNVSQHDYPPHVVCAARLLRNFANELNRKINKAKGKEKPEGEEKSECEKKPECKEGTQNDDTIEDDWWTTVTMVLISNHLNELMIVVRQEKVDSLVPHLKTYFKCVIGKHPNIVSVLGFHTSNRYSKIKNLKRKVRNKNNRQKKLLIAGTPVLRDKIGPLSMQYDLANHCLFFDSVETMQLGKVIQDYMCLTKQTTLLDIGSNLGVLSLIMAHRCEKVIRLTAEPRAKNLINESEKLKEANLIHNASFVKFNTENIITICEPLIEQCMTVAVVKLKTLPILGGPLAGVMKALRNLPSIWRVLLYGPFTDQLHDSIAVLTSEDDSMGERYLPMQGCILDKSPAVIDAFDIVVLFERKSLIAPKVELFAPGPTLNVAVDSETCDDNSMNAQEVKFELPLDADQGLANSKENHGERQSLSTVTKKKSQFLPSISVRKEFKRISSPPPTETFPDDKQQQSANNQTAHSLPGEVEFRFDHPPPPLGTFPPFSYPPPPVTEKLQFNVPPPPFQGIPFHLNPSGPTREDFQNEHPAFLDSRFPSPHFQSEPYPPVREDLHFNCPLPLPQRHFNAPTLQDPHVQNDFQDHYYPPLPSENYYHPPHHPKPYPVVNNQFQNLPPPLLPLMSLILPKAIKPPQPKKKKPEFFYPPPPTTRFPSPPPLPPLPPPEETDLLEENLSASSSSTTVIDERMQVCKEEKVSEIVNTAEDVISSVMIKSEPIESSYSADIPEVNGIFSETICHSPTTTVKEESMQVCQEKVRKIVHASEDLVSNVSVKSEPIDPSYSVDLSEANVSLSEANCYTPMTTVKTEPLPDQVIKESNIADYGTTVKTEALQDEVKKEFTVADSETSFNVIVKSELTNQSSSGNLEANGQNMALPVSVESEAFSPIRSCNCEPMDMQISPSPPDFQSMETPIHNRRALSDITPVTLSKNVSVAGSEFPVQTNQSFLGIVKPKAAVNVDREPGEISDSDGENEEKNKQQNKLPQKHVFTVPVVSRKLNRPFPGKYSESPYKRRNHGRSPSPKRMRRSPTPDGRRRRLPVSARRIERSRRSRSPRDRRNRRSRSRSPRRR